VEVVETWPCPNATDLALALTPDKRQAIILGQTRTGFNRDIATETSTPINLAVAGDSCLFRPTGACSRRSARKDNGCPELRNRRLFTLALHFVAFSRTVPGSPPGAETEAVWLWDVESQHALLVLSDSRRHISIRHFAGRDGVGSADHTGRLFLGDRRPG
jgi:hypothetical protein